VTWRRDGYEISTDPARLDREAIWRFLRTAPWSHGIARDVVERAIDNSIPFGLLAPDESQAGFARVVTSRFGFRPVDATQVMERPTAQP
jgi:hypothetical protein